MLKYCSLYSNISFGKKGALFIAKKGTFGSWQKFRGGTCPLCPPGSYAPGYFKSASFDTAFMTSIILYLNVTCMQRISSNSQFLAVKLISIISSFMAQQNLHPNTVQGSFSKLLSGQVCIVMHSKIFGSDSDWHWPQLKSLAIQALRRDLKAFC